MFCLLGVMALSSLILGIGLFLSNVVIFPDYKCNNVHCVTFFKEIKREDMNSPMNSPSGDNQS